ncbi:MAG: RagB/SusD family nutrient uptake outer membrane protein, partial [bacterium]
ANGSSTTGSSNIGFSIWPAISSSVPVIRNEELILLRAEAKLGTGDKAGAIADLNIVRTNSGGLPPSTLTAASSNDDILLGILYEKRYSLMMEGDRWVDHRRYGKLALLPLDIPSGPNKNFVAKVSPIPQAECLVRAKSTGALLGPSGLNNCAP